jgi:hypothetical protein
MSSCSLYQGRLLQERGMPEEYREPMGAEVIGACFKEQLKSNFDKKEINVSDEFNFLAKALDYGWVAALGLVGIVYKSNSQRLDEVAKTAAAAKLFSTSNQ